MPPIQTGFLNFKQMDLSFHKGLAMSYASFHRAISDDSQELDPLLIQENMIFCQPMNDMFEPIPLCGSQTNQESVDLSYGLKESIKLLCHNEKPPSLTIVEDPQPNVSISSEFKRNLDHVQDLQPNVSISSELKRNENHVQDPQPNVSISSEFKRNQDHVQDSEDGPKAKLQRLALPQTDEFYCALRFRPYQAEQWDLKFDELLEFKQRYGHCGVPHTYQENRALARWVKRQRYQYKLKQDGKVSTMTDCRIKTLERIGFVWDAHSEAWEERLHDLMMYRAEHEDCNVPTHFAPNKQLATWVKCQRRQYKLLRAGKQSTMTIDRSNTLDRMGFTWEIRGVKKI
jgi:hypothetical protein